MKDTKGKYFLKYLYAHATGHASVLLDAIAPSIVLSVRVAGIALLLPFMLCHASDFGSDTANIHKISRIRKFLDDFFIRNVS